MATKRAGLGKKNSLEMLLSSTGINPEQGDVVLATSDTNDKQQQLSIDQLQRGQYQPRRHMAPEALQELADSIKAQGIIQPIVVRPLSIKNRYEIIAGERRWRAAQLAGLELVPVVIKNIPDDAALAMALIENIQREDLNPIEEAIALQRLLDEFAMTHQEVADTVGKSRVTVTNLLRLLQLAEEVKTLLMEGKIELGHAKVLLALQSSEQTQAAKIVAMNGLTVRETEALVKKSLNQNPAAKATSNKIDPHIRRLETNLAEKLGAMVKFNHQQTGKGKLFIHYNSLDELQGILTQLGMQEDGF